MLSSETEAQDEVKRSVVLEVERGHAPSVSVAWLLGGDEVVMYAAGHSRLESKTPATTNTAYSWFSTTKLFTATAVLQLVAAGKVSLDECAAKYVSGLPFAADATPTVGQLLSHTSGLSNPMPLRWIHLAAEHGPTLEQMTKRLLNANSRLKFAPGTRYSYTNLGYLVLGLLIQRVSGIAFEDYITRYLLEPLGMKSSGFAVGNDFASGYSRVWSFMGVVGRIMLDRKYFGATCDGYTELKPFEVDGAPYGGLGGTATDMLQLGRAMIASGSIGEMSVIEASLARLAISPVAPKDGPPFPMGLGWHLGNFHGEPFANHLGGGAGFRSELRIYPRINQAIAIVANETSFDTSVLAQLPVQR